MIYEGSIVHVSKGWMLRKSCMYICWWCHMHWTQSYALNTIMSYALNTVMSYALNTIICQISEHNHLPDQSSNKANKQANWSHDTEPYLWNCTFISGANFFIQRNMGDVSNDRDSREVVFLSFPYLMSHPAAVSAVTVLTVLTEHWGFPLTLVTDVFNRGLFHLKLLHA